MKIRHWKGVDLWTGFSVPLLLDTFLDSETENATVSTNLIPHCN